MRTRIFASFVALAAGAATTPVQAQTEPVAMLGQPLKILHMFSDASGVGRLEAVPVTASAPKSGPPTIFNITTSRGRLIYVPDGANDPFSPASPHRIAIFLQGTYFIRFEDGVEHRIEPGTVLFAEDRGKGHAARCEAKTAPHHCLLLVLAVPDDEKSILGAMPGPAP